MTTTTNTRSFYRNTRESIRATFLTILKGNAKGTMSLAAQTYTKDTAEYKQAYLDFNWILTQLQGNSSMETFNIATRPNLMAKAKETSAQEVVTDIVLKLEEAFDKQEVRTPKAKVVFAEADFFASSI